MFAALLLLGAVIVFVETRGMSFFADDWDFVVARRGLTAHSLLTPHGPHLSIVPILIWKVLLAVFGGGSYVPFRLLVSLDIVILGLALGIACRDRWGRWWGLAPVLLLVTLGPGAVTLLWPFQVGYTLAIAFGLVALVAIDRGGRWSDAIACISLIVSLGSASQGIGFVVGAALVIVLGGNWLRRSWVFVFPALLYLLWYATDGHQYSETHLSLWGGSLNYLMQSLSATAGAVVGLSSVSPQTGTLDLTFGVPIAVALVAAVGAAAWRGWRPRTIFWGASATLVVVWFAASVSDFGVYSRPPTDPRYLSSNAVLLFVCICAALPRPRLARGGVIIALIVLCVIGATNVHQYGQQHRSFVASSEQERAELGGLELLRGTSVSPTYDPGVVDGDLAAVRAAAFFSAASSFGLNEDSPAQIAAQPETTRAAVDQILAPNELSLSANTGAAAPAATVTVLAGDPRRRGGCLIIGATPLDLALTPGSLTVTASMKFPATVAAGRFASTYGYGVGTVAPGTTEHLRVASDAAQRTPWRLTLTGTGTRVCPAR